MRKASVAAMHACMDMTEPSIWYLSAAKVKKTCSQAGLFQFHLRFS